MSMRFDLTDLRLFTHVAEAANITQGASRTNMALASASERIRGMEDSLGVPLLERKRRGVHLTPAGRRSCTTRAKYCSSWKRCAMTWTSTRRV
jgi:DNA-binding transcriptional LysR family regulator